jgi:DNA polymerase-3 subunit delta
MAPSTFKAFKAALASGTFDPVYVFHGADDHLKDETVRALIARASDEATRDFNLEVLRGGELDVAALSTALEALPMLADRRVVVLRDPGAMRKAGKDRLQAYLKKPAPEVLLVLAVPATAKADAALLAGGTALEFKSLEGGDLKKWIAHESATANGTTISDAAAARLAAYGGSDLALLAGELRKLAAFTNGATIDADAVEAVTGVRPGVTMSDLLDRVGERDTATAITMVEDVLAQPKNSGVTTVLAITSQVLAIGWGLAARARGMPAHQVEREYFGLLKEAGNAFTGRPWGEATKAWARYLPRWTAADVTRALPHLAAADSALKDTKVSSEAQIVISLLLALAPTTARRAA